MGMPSIFRQKMESRSSETMQLNPSSMIAIGVKTADVIRGDSEKNSFFLAINNMSANHLQDVLLQYDSVKTGLSFVAKAPGASKQDKAWVNPKTYQALFGGAWGKTADSSGDGMMTGDGIFSGGHNPLITIIGLTTHKIPPPAPTPVGDINNSTPATTTSSSGVTTSGSITKMDPVEKDIEDVKKELSGRASDTRVDPKTGKTLRGPNPTILNANGQNASTGSVLIPPTSIGEKIKNSFLNNMASPGFNYITNTANKAVNSAEVTLKKALGLPK